MSAASVDLARSERDLMRLPDVRTDEPSADNQDGTAARIAGVSAA